MTSTRPTLHDLSSQDCYARLRDASFGRLGVLVGQYPAVIPVNYALDEDVIVFATAAGSLLARADHHNVTFQIDEIDPASRSGWSVLVRGQLEQVRPDRDPARALRSALAGVDSYARVDDLGAGVGGTASSAVWMRVIPHGISGRTVHPVHAPDDWSLGWAAYL